MTSVINNFKFKQPRLLTTALTHRSVLNEKKHTQSYERLEFLGDAVLELIVSDYLYSHFKDKPEGQLTHLRSKIVQTKTLAQAAKTIGLDKSLILSKGEKLAGGQNNPSLLADCFESVIGAIYLDQGLTKAKDFIFTYLIKNLTAILANDQIVDYKSQLQEFWQKKTQHTPKYKLIKTYGPDHNKTFLVKVYLNSRLHGEGIGKSKQLAQQQAAKAALEKNKGI